MAKDPTSTQKRFKATLSPTPAPYGYGLVSIDPQKLAGKHGVQLSASISYKIKIFYSNQNSY
jgi:hypothetical protein